jgi:hypothetical protein
MKESTTYQYILREGAIAEMRKMVLRHGQRRFGPPSEAVRSALEAITDLERLERMGDRVHEVSSWQEVLDTP